MSNIGPTYPAHFIVSQAEVRLVADQTSSATAATIKSDQNQIEAAQEIEAAEAKQQIAWILLPDGTGQHVGRPHEKPEAVQGSHSSR